MNQNVSKSGMQRRLVLVSTDRVVPSDLRDRLEEEAASMGVPLEWVLRACIEIGLEPSDEHVLELVFAVEKVRDDLKKAELAQKQRRG